MIFLSAVYAAFFLAFSKTLDDSIPERGWLCSRLPCHVRRLSTGRQQFAGVGDRLLRKAAPQRTRVSALSALKSSNCNNVKY